VFNVTFRHTFKTIFTIGIFFIFWIERHFFLFGRKKRKMSSIDRSIDIEPNETKTNEIVQPEINSIHLHKCVNETFQNEKKKRENVICKLFNRMNRHHHHHLQMNFLLHSIHLCLSLVSLDCCCWLVSVEELLFVFDC